MSVHNDPHIQNEPARHPELMLADLLKELDNQTFNSCKAAEPLDALDPNPSAPKPNIRRSSREKRLTPKMQEFMEQQSVQREKGVRRKIDACAEVTADLMQFMKVHLSETGEDFDAEAERRRLRLLLDKEYAKSIYGSTAPSTSSVANSSKPGSETPSIALKKTEMAAQLAAKRVECEMENLINAQRQELKRLEQKRDLEVMEAKLKVYTEEESRGCSQKHSPARSNATASRPTCSCHETKEASTNETSLLQALSDSVLLDFQFQSLACFSATH